MGVKAYTDCTGCGRYGTAYEDTNYVYECGRCEIDRLDTRIKNATRQVWWIEILYWLTDRKPVAYNREHIKMLAEGLTNEY